MGRRKTIPGYATDIITDLSLEWLKQRDPDRPFFLMVHHKAPHRPWQPDAKHAHLYEDVEIPEPPTFYDDYSNRAAAAAAAEMRIDRDMTFTDLKEDPPEGLTPLERKRWNYQRYIKDTSAAWPPSTTTQAASLDYLDAEGLTENTVVIYTSDQGFSWAITVGTTSASLRGIAAHAVSHPLSERDRAGHEQRRNHHQPRLCAFVPRLCRFAGARLDAGPQFPVDFAGKYSNRLARVDVLPLLHARRRAQRLRLIMECGPVVTSSSTITRTIRARGSGNCSIWKKDPYEMRNVVNEPEYAEVVEQLKAELHQPAGAVRRRRDPWEGEPAFTE